MLKGLIILVLMCCGATLHAQLTYQTLEVDYDSAHTFKNLKIIPVRLRSGGNNGGREAMISLSQGLAAGTVVVTERGTAATENVHWLRINNNSGVPVYIGSGEVIMGGRQDRMITKDTVLLPAEKDQYIPVMCVEEGRWSDKQKKFVYNNYANAQLRKVLGTTNNQVLVWKEIDRQLNDNGFHSSSLAYLAQRHDKKMAIPQNEYHQYFHNKFMKEDTSVVGMICISGDKIIGCDIYAGKGLFDASLDALLYGYIEEALLHGQPPVVTDERVVTYLAPKLTSEEEQKEHLKKNGKIYTHEKRVIHITGFGE
ncbi:MAG: hypothetical protein J7578_23425 [Chitinophagaceae bacterium]|nr:hypothetical protein [Chitinophagaceae bacterium]